MTIHQGEYDIDENLNCYWLIGGNPFLPIRFLIETRYSIFTKPDKVILPITADGSRFPNYLTGLKEYERGILRGRCNGYEFLVGLQIDKARIIALENATIDQLGGIDFFNYFFSSYYNSTLID